MKQCNLKPYLNSFVIILIFTISGLLITAPVYGLSLSSLVQSINSIKSEIEGEMNVIRTIANNRVNSSWAGTFEDANAAINDSIGAVGSPDPVSSSENLLVAIAKKYSWSLGAEKSLSLQRELTRASVSAVIGSPGQKYTAQKINETTNTTNDATDLGEQAQDMNASQNILKVIAAQNGQIVSMLGQQRTDSLESRQDIAQSNLMLVQMNEQLAGKTKLDEIRNDGLVSLNHELLGMSVLDPTYTPSQ